MNAAQVENQHAVDEDEEIVVAVEAQAHARDSVVHEVVAGLIGEVGIVLHPRYRHNPTPFGEIRRDG